MYQELVAALSIFYIITLISAAMQFVNIYPGKEVMEG